MVTLDRRRKTAFLRDRAHKEAFFDDVGSTSAYATATWPHHSRWPKMVLHPKFA
jgi:hypothetical protein